MNVILPGIQEQWIQDQVERGNYQSVNEVVQEAIRLLQEYDDFRRIRVEKLRQELQIGVDQLDRGEGISFSDEFAEQIKRRGREQIKAKTR